MKNSLRQIAGDGSQIDMPGEITETERQLSWLINDINKLMSRTYARKMKRHGVTEAQWRVIANVARAEGATQTQLAEILGTERAPLGRLLDRMEVAGLVERRADPQDRRINRIYLKEEAREIDPLLEAMAAEGYNLLSAAVEGIEDAELEATLAVLDRIKQNLQDLDTREA